MMMLKSLLQDKKTAVVQRWLDDILASYAKGTGSFLNRTKDRFANPVGHALRVGTQAIFDSLIEGLEPDGIYRYLEDVIKIRAIQDFTPSQAVSFVFLLKKAVREELGKEAENPHHLAGLKELDSDIDRIALLAFDIYMQCREQFCEIRVNEIKRSVAVMTKMFDGRNPDPVSDGNCSVEKSKCTSARRGGDR
ncbi:MAG: RsbRD N-terminal domain-containing protein [Planctomycetota bacterium]|jgi:hypothetical protein